MDVGFFFPLKSLSLFCTHLKSLISRLCYKFMNIFLVLPIARYIFFWGGEIELFSLIFLTVEGFYP